MAQHARHKLAVIDNSSISCFAKEHVSSLRTFSSNELYCPITRKLFHKPVLAADGMVYEESAIMKWIPTHQTSPVTGQSLKSFLVFPLKMMERTVDTMASARMLPADGVKELHVKRQE